MKYTTAAALVAGTAVVSAQTLPSTIPILGLPFGQQCQQTVLGLFTNGSFSQCFPAPALLPLLTGTSDSIVPTLDNFMTELCYNEPCSNDTLTQAAQQITQGCASDLQASNISSSTIEMIFDVYPTLREVLCLKTTDYYTEESYGGFLGEAPIPISDAYNLTDGAFCVSSVLTQISAYVDANLTIDYITSAVTGSNQTAQDLFTSIQPNFLCNGCIFGAVDVIASAYPEVADIPVAQVAAYANISVPTGNATLQQVMDQECAYIPLAVNTTQLPPGVSVSIVNSTFADAPADGESVEADTPTPSNPEGPAPEVPAGVPSEMPPAAEPSAAAPSAPAEPSVAAPSAPVESAASAAAPSLPAVDPSATPAAPSASA